MIAKRRQQLEGVEKRVEVRYDAAPAWHAEPTETGSRTVQRMRRMISAMRGLNCLLVGRLDSPGLIDAICRELVDSGLYPSAWIVLFDKHRHVREHAAAHIRGAMDGFVACLNRGETPPCVADALAGRGVARLTRASGVCAQCPNGPEGDGGYAFSTALRCEGRLYGVLTVFAWASDADAPNEPAILGEMGDCVAYALHKRTIAREKRRSENECREAEDRFAVFMDHLPAGVVMRDPAGRILYANRFMQEHFGAGAWIGKSLAEVYGPERGEALRREDAIVLAEGPCSLATRVPDGAGSERMVDECRFPVRRDDGEELIGVISLDVTNLRDAMSERRQAILMLEQSQKMEAVGQLTGGVAHDFNNVLTAIIGYAEMLHDELEASGAATEKLEVIRQAADQAASLTAQLLAFSRKGSMEEQLLDLNAIVDPLRKVLLRVLGEDVELVWRPGAKLHHVKGGHTQIVQILMNLAVNARDAMPDGGELIIETHNVTPGPAFRNRHPAFPGGEAVALRIVDTGTGIDEETRPHIFEPFYTTKTVGHGTGLGLATVMQIVRQYGAALELESAPGAGSAFTIIFPASEGEGEGAAPAVAEAGASASDGIILVVEDEPPVRELACELLKLDGYTVIEAANASEAERFSEQFGGRIHLLLSDVIMPRMSGPDLYERLKRRRPDLEVLFMSGYTDDRIGEKALSDPNRLLRKPFSRGKLLKTVRTVLDASAAGANASVAD